MRRPTLILLMLFLAVSVSAQLKVTPAQLPEASLGVLYYQEFHAIDGAAPYRWSVSGRLPPGITFESQAATLTGIPNTPGEYRFNINVVDASRRSFSRFYVLRVGAGITITLIWTRTPAVANGGISGEVEVSNPGREAFDLTFIAVAVNEIGRATALGYQRFTLGQGKQRIPFGTTLPRGTYVVHADAVGEIARSGTIRRARLQSLPLTVP